MDIKKLEKIGCAPKSGILLAYLRDRVVFRKYSSIEEVKEKMEGENVLEIHLFDRNIEYRALCSNSRRFPSGIIEEVADFPYSPDSDSCFKSEAVLGNIGDGICDGMGRLAVINHLNYDKNGSIAIDNYRLVGEA